jgi:hypothetical protein
MTINDIATSINGGHGWRVSQNWDCKIADHGNMMEGEGKNAFPEISIGLPCYEIWGRNMFPGVCELVFPD